MKKLFYSTTIILLAVILFSCQKESLESDQKNAETNNDQVGGRTDLPPSCTPTVVTLIAGQNIDAGTVTVTNDASFYYVTYQTANGYTLTQTHLYVGECALIPVNNQGNPIPGHFPYNTTHNNITTYTYQVPLSVIGPGNCGCIAAHAVVVKLNAAGQIIDQQTGWGNGTLINPSGGNWGMKFEYCTCL